MHLIFWVERRILPWNFIGIEVLIGVGLAEKLHPEDGENVDDNDKEESEVAKSTQSWNDDTQQDFHRGPRLS